MTPDAGADTAPATTTRVTPRRRAARAALLAVVFVCAACGLVYELALVSLGSYLIGNTATQASIVLAVMVFAMGIGSLAAKPLQHRPVVWFAVVELTLALLGGLSVMGLYAAFAYLSMYTEALVVVAFVLGLLIGAEIPLLMVLLQRIRRQDAGSAVADLFAADYIGALLGGLAFPFLLLPAFGQLRGALVVGLVNAVAGLLLVFLLFRRDLSRRGAWAVGAGAAAVIAILVAAFAYSTTFEVTARQALYRDPIVLSKQSQYQDIVLTSRSTPDGDDVRLFLNGDLQFSSADEYRYHEALVHPAMAAHPKRVLILGAGDGLALREVLAYPTESITLVDLDPAMIDLARTDPRLTRLNRGSMNDPRATVVAADAFTWLRTNDEKFDAIIIDMPDPDETPTAKLYSTEFYAMVAAHLRDGGVISVQAGSPYFAPRSYWCVGATLGSAGLRTLPYHVDVPSFGDWGYFLAARDQPVLRMNPPTEPRFLSDDELRAAQIFPRDRPPLDMPPSTLMDPRILRYAQGEWKQY
ncbi:spermidine synthase [Gordonia araii NBRC 100433]|uniref:Polyamine aminopropyltransferase n=1 Tax=Gordonia araii NBRC 100433 TaxID=1073574 RepID=G7GZ92_9ACTN|nr:polyamine aminopropyltransferase [Gordonia araii]NNG97125.1 polyamine aminopropyltransferase [Gordonia araii NBRC 100433]GAB08917.1 spermidine synthase [Gordonia araii NBRC 100433]